MTEICRSRHLPRRHGTLGSNTSSRFAVAFLAALVLAGFGTGTTPAGAAPGDATSTTATSTTTAPAPDATRRPTSADTTTKTTSTTATAVTPPSSAPSAPAPTDGGADEIAPPTPEEKADVEARVRAYEERQRQGRGAASGAAPATTSPPDWMPWIGTPTVWCTYGNPNSPGDYCHNYHEYKALDIGMDVGTDIRASGGGVVVSAENDCTAGDTACGGGAGNHVSISHGGTIFSRYMHMSRVDVEVGDEVNAGDHIGLSGWTGHVSPVTKEAAHLHYEEDDQYGNAIDPGEMRRCVDGQVLTTLAAGGWQNWKQVPWGTRLRNDGISCLGSQPPSPPWTGAIPFGGSTLARIASGTNRDGRQEIFVVGAYSLLWHSYQLSNNGSWSNWAPYTGVSFPPSATPATVVNSDGRLEVFIVGSGTLWHTYQLVPNGAWSALESLGGSLSGDPSVGRNADGHLEVVALNTDGTAWHTWQQAANSGWLGWYRLGGAWPGGTVFGVAANADNRLEVFGVGHDSQVWHSWQGTPNGMFSAFSPLGGGWPRGRPLAVTRMASGRLTVLGTTDRGTVEQFTQIVPNGSWGGVMTVSSGWTSAPAAITDRSGRLDIAASAGSNGLAVQSQATNGLWLAIMNVGGSGSIPPGIGMNADGRVEAFFSGSNGAIYHAWQQRAP